MPLAQTTPSQLPADANARDALRVAWRQTDAPSAWTAPVLLVDDDPAFRAWLDQGLTGFGCTVCVAQSGPDGLERALARSWQAVILGAKLPGLDGAELVRRLRQHSEVPVLIVSAHPGDMEEIASLEAGADAYLAKGSSVPQILAHLRAVARRAANGDALGRQSAPPPEAIVVGELRIEPQTHRATLAGQELILTPGEFAILLSLAKAKGRVKTRDCLYAEVCGREYGAFDRALDMQVCGLRRKLGDCPKCPRFIRTIRSAGYMLVAPDAR